MVNNLPGGQSGGYLQDHRLTIASYAVLEPGVLGPNSTFAIWLQGCDKPTYCPGCIAPNHQGFSGGKSIPVQELAQIVLESYRQFKVNGLTVSGGEPTAQAGAVAQLLIQVAFGISAYESRSLEYCLPHHTIPFIAVVYSGWTLRQITQDPAKKRLLFDPATGKARQCIDVLIDGPYVQELNDNKGPRGSSNQRRYILTSDPAKIKAINGWDFNGPRKVQITSIEGVEDGAGVPPSDLLANYKFI